MMKVLVFGGRDFSDYVAISKCLETLHSNYPNMCVVHGGARGADSLAGRWAKNNGVPEIIMPAHWDALGKAAGMARNRWMLEWAQPNYAVGFPGGVGTTGMRSLVVAAGITLWEPLA